MGLKEDVLKIRIELGGVKIHVPCLLGFSDTQRSTWQKMLGVDEILNVTCLWSMASTCLSYLFSIVLCT